MSQIKKGVILNYATIIITNVVGLLLTPYMLKKLGTAEFGLYTLIGSLVGYIAVLDFGLTHTIVRFVAKYRAEKDRKGEENFLATTMLIYLGISFLVILIGICCYLNLESIFKNSLIPNEIYKAKIMFAILIFNLALVLPGGAFVGIFSGYEQFVFPKALNIIKYIIRSLMLVALLSFGGKAISIVILDTVLNIFIIGVNMYYAFAKLKVRFKLYNFNTVLVKDIFAYSIWIFAFMIVSQFQWKTGQMVLGIISNTTAVAVFAIGIMLGGYYGAFSSAITSIFIPRATQMTVANATSDDLTRMMIKIGRLSLISLFYILGAFIMLGKEFVFLWVGKEYYQSYLIAVVIMCAYTVPLTQGFANAILEARNKLAFKAIIHLIFLAIGTLVGAIIAKKHGAFGMAIGSVIGWLIAQNIMNYYYHNIIKVNIITFFKEVYIKITIALILVLVIVSSFNYLPMENNWMVFICKALMYSVIFFGIFYSYAVNEYEKSLVKQLISKLKK